MTVFNVFKNQVYSEKSRVCQRKEKGIPCIVAKVPIIALSKRPSSKHSKTCRTVPEIG